MPLGILGVRTGGRGGRGIRNNDGDAAETAGRTIQERGEVRRRAGEGYARLTVK